MSTGIFYSSFQVSRLYLSKLSKFLKLFYTGTYYSVPGAMYSFFFNLEAVNVEIRKIGIWELGKKKKKKQQQ